MTHFMTYILDRVNSKHPKSGIQSLVIKGMNSNFPPTPPSDQGSAIGLIKELVSKKIDRQMIGTTRIIQIK